MQNLLDIRQLEKRFGDQVVLRGVNLQVTADRITGLIGPSGSGKTTLIKTALGMEKSSGGSATVLGKTMPNRLALAKMGYMAQSDALYLDLTARENLQFFGQMKGLTGTKLKDDVEHVAGIVYLTTSLDKRVQAFSGGMKRRLSLAIALLASPHLLILDEPTVGIDPALSKQIWAELKRRRDAGCGVLVTTHVMSEAEQVDSVALLMQGTIIANDTPQNLKKQYQVDSIEGVFLKAEKEVED